MRISLFLPSAVFGLVGLIETVVGAVQVATQGEPTLGMQWLQTGLVLSIGTALIVSHVRFKDRTRDQAEADRVAAAKLVVQAEERAAKLVAEAEDRHARSLTEAEERAERQINKMHEENQRILVKTGEHLEKLATAFGEMSTLLYGARGRPGVVDDLAHASAIRHMMLDHLSGLEAWAYSHSEAICAKFPELPRYHSPAPIERRQWRSS